MLKEERFNHILKKLSDHQKVTLSEVSEELLVSEDTVRRDIEELSKSGRLKRVRGGAVPHSPNARLHAFKDRIHVLEKDKQIIAAKAVALLQAGQVIILDGGTTTYTMAGMLPLDLQLTVVTNNIPVAALLADHPTVEVVLAGGKVFKSSNVLPLLRIRARLRSFAGLRMANSSFLCRLADESRPTATASMSEKFRPAISRQLRTECFGKPAKYLTRFRRSSAIATIGEPSTKGAADAPA